MSVLVNSDVNIFPVTNQRADSTAHYLNEPHLVKWLLQLVDKKSFVTTPDETITVGQKSEEFFEFFIDGYYLAVKKRAIEDWITANSTIDPPSSPSEIYAFLNIYDNYVKGDNVTAQEPNSKIKQPVIAYVSYEKTPLDSCSLSSLFDTSNGKILSTAKIVLNKNCNYFINFNSSTEDPIELTYSNTNTGGNTTHYFKSADGVVKITGTLDQHIFNVTNIEASDVTLSAEGATISLTYETLSTEFLGLELTTNPEPNPTIQLDSDPEPDTATTTPLHILTKQSAVSYIVPKPSKLKFESYSINLDGGEV